MTPEYLAGFFDGEGCIDVQRMYPSDTNARTRFYCRPRVRIAQAVSGQKVLVALAERFGGHFTKRKPSATNQQASMSWEFLDRAGMVDMLELILPHLILKKEQAKLALWWLKNMAGRRAAAGDDTLERARVMFAAELKLMKLDPQRLSEEAVSRIEALMR